jgi:hypothetical protein
MTAHSKTITGTISTHGSQQTNATYFSILSYFICHVLSICGGNRMKEFFLNDPIKINHPLANRMSVQNSPSHYCTPGQSSEIAFFRDGIFQTAIIEEFANYASDEDADTRIYNWVPDELIDEFLELFGV